MPALQQKVQEETRICKHISKFSTPDEEASSKDESTIGMLPNYHDQSLSSTFNMLVCHGQGLLYLVPSHAILKSRIGNMGLRDRFNTFQFAL